MFWSPCVFSLITHLLPKNRRERGMGSREDTCSLSHKKPMQRTTGKKKPTCVSSQFSKAPTLVGGRHNIRSLCFSFFCSLLASIITNFCLSKKKNSVMKMRFSNGFHWYPIVHVLGLVCVFLVNYTSDSWEQKRKEDGQQRRHLGFEQQIANAENRPKMAHLCWKLVY